MFACPHCHFENPITNRFCQRCGSALRGLRAVFIPTLTHPATDCKPAEFSTSAADAVVTTSVVQGAQAVKETKPPVLTVAHLLTDDHHLQGQPRYQLRHPEAASQLLQSELLLEIIDCEPAADSPLAQRLDAVLETDELAAIAEELPPLAHPYWQLQEHFFPMVPELQAAWQEENGTVIVLEDRSTWKSVISFTNSADLETLELVHWFYEIINLWEALTRFQAETSLLDLDNLKVDDDQILCIQRLIYDDSDQPRSLKELGLFWHTLLQDLHGPSVPALENLITDIGAGVITDAATIEEILANIAENLQAEEESEQLSPSAPAATTANPPPTSDAAIAASNDPVFALSLSDLIPADKASLEDFDETEDADTEAIEDSLADLPTMALPMKLYRLDEVGRTHVGRQRTHNEDCFFAETQLTRSDSPSGSALKARGLYILCDGMGGHSGGEVASALAVSTLRDYFTTHWHSELPSEAAVTEAILKANQAIFDKNEAEGRSGNARMGTTLVMVLIDDTQIVAAHVGDSRLYALTRQGFHQLTEDHEVGQREINRGVEPAIAYTRPDAYQLTQALGPRGNAEVKPTVNMMQISQDTLFLLCSDGLSDNDLLETHLNSHLEPMLRTRHDLEEGVANLIDLANEHNGHDNITAIAVRIKMRPNLEGT